MRKFLRKYLLATVLVVVALLVIGSAGTMTYVNTPNFCSRCHVMTPYYQSWKASHHNKVACVDCHYAPGEKYKLSAKMHALNQVVAYWTGTYDTKFYTEVKDASCMTSGCHSVAKLAGPVNFSPADDGGVQIKFNHQQHYGVAARGITLRCTSCHNHTIKGHHMAVDKTACFLCHFKDKVSGVKPVPQKFCLTCHDYPKQDIQVSGMTYNHADFVQRGVDCQRCHLDAVVGQGEVAKTACMNCHDDPKVLAKLSSQPELHNIHVRDHKVDCFRCHSEIRHGVHVEGGAQVKFACEQCHTQTHMGPRELYSGHGGRGVPDSPSPMYLAHVNCVACHLDQHTFGAEGVMKGEVMRPTVKGCVDCHGDTGQQFFEQWTKSLADGISAATVVVAKAGSAVDLAGAGVDPAKLAQAKSKVGDAQYNLDFVRYGRGIHNVDYALALLEKAKQDAQEAQSLVGK